jgi:hypothetical protein
LPFVRLRGDETSLPQSREMRRDTRLRKTKTRCQLAYGGIPLQQRHEKLNPNFVSKGIG